MATDGPLRVVNIEDIEHFSLDFAVSEWMLISDALVAAGIGGRNGQILLDRIAAQIDAYMGKDYWGVNDGE